MNQNELQKARIHSDFIKRAFTFYRIALVMLIIGAIFIPQAFAVEDMWTAADRIIKDVYSKIAAISTVLAGLMSAVAVIGAKMSGAQQKADQAWDWRATRSQLKRLCTEIKERKRFTSVELIIRQVE